MVSLTGKLKLLVLGLDGATFDIIMPAIKKGQLPTFERLMKNGVFGKLESTIPPQTAPAWVSFMTGKNPGKHGIISFMDYNPQRYDAIYEQKINTPESYSGSTFFDLLSSNGHKVGVITLPMTYPPWSINGIMISGYPCPDTDKIYSTSKGINLNIKEKLNFDANYYQTASEEQVFNDGLEMSEKRTNLAIDLVRNHNLDCLILVLGEIDRAQHDFWIYFDKNISKLLSNKKVHNFKDAILKTYQNTEIQIEKLLSLTDEKTMIFIISDHGGGPYPKIFFNTNRWLRNLRLLELNKNKAKRFDLLRDIYDRYVNTLKRKSKLILKIDQLILNKKRLRRFHLNNFNWEKTKAFRYPMAYPADGIVINLEGRQEKGIVKKGKEYHDLRNYIIDELKKLSHPITGEKVVKNCYKREELYDGIFLEKLPDIIFLLEDNFFHGRSCSGDIFTNIPSTKVKNERGVHHIDGIFLANGQVFNRGERINNIKIIDIAPTILYSMGIPIPKDIDGNVQIDLFTEKFKSSTKVNYQLKIKKKEGARVSLTNKEQEEIKIKLRGLGYID